MSCSSYAKLGSQCEPNNLYSLTSNTKYINPENKIYYKSYTPMMQYPAHSTPNVERQHDYNQIYEQQQQCTKCKN